MVRNITPNFLLSTFQGTVHNNPVIRDLPDKLPRAYSDNYEPGILIRQQQVIDRKMLFRLINLDKYQDLLYYKSCRIKDVFRKGTNQQIFCRLSGWFPDQKEVDMNDFNLTLFLIFLILFILKNGSHQKKIRTVDFLQGIRQLRKLPPCNFIIYYIT